MTVRLRREVRLQPMRDARLTALFAQYGPQPYARRTRAGGRAHPEFYARLMEHLTGEPHRGPFSIHNRRG